MGDTLHAPDRQKLSWRDAAATRARSTIGFWVGGGLLGTGGCILGVCMPYHHPVAVVISALWWGIYLGCLGGSVGALIAMFLNGIGTGSGVLNPETPDPVREPFLSERAPAAGAGATNPFTNRR